MRILFYGSGVIGSVLAARLHSSGEEITVLARGDRLKEIRKNGIVIENRAGGERISAPVATIESLGPDDDYDLVIVPVRADHLSGVLPALAANRRIPSVLFMVNNPHGPGEIVRAMGAERVLLGFPGFGGGMQAGSILYELAPSFFQKTTLGEIDGRMTQRLRGIAAAFKRAGFPVALEKNMDTWQKTHLCWVVPFALAIYTAGCSNYELAGRRDLLLRMTMAMRECLDMLENLGVPARPAKFGMLKRVPPPLLARIFSLSSRTRSVETLAALHCRNAPREMKQLTDGLLAIADRSGVPVPHLRELAPAIDPYLRQEG
jgi:2-dehydropantoate 2-reductase